MFHFGTIHTFSGSIPRICNSIYFSHSYEFLLQWTFIIKVWDIRAIRQIIHYFYTATVGFTAQDVRNSLNTYFLYPIQHRIKK
jgi:hypothetical protein